MQNQPEADPLAEALMELRPKIEETMSQALQMMGALAQGYAEMKWQRGGSNKLKDGQYNIHLEIEAIQYKDTLIELELSPPPQLFKDRLGIKIDGQEIKFRIKPPASELATLIRDRAIDCEPALEFRLKYESAPNLPKLKTAVENYPQPKTGENLEDYENARELRRAVEKQIDAERALAQAIRLMGTCTPEENLIMQRMEQNVREAQEAYHRSRESRAYDTTVWKSAALPVWPIDERLETRIEDMMFDDKGYERQVARWSGKYLKLFAKTQTQPLIREQLMWLYETLGALSAAEIREPTRGPWIKRLKNDLVQYIEMVRRLPAWLTRMENDKLDYEAFRTLNQMQRLWTRLLGDLQKGLKVLEEDRSCESGSVEEMMLHGARRTLMQLIISMNWTDPAHEKELFNEASANYRGFGHTEKIARYIKTIEERQKWTEEAYKRVARDNSTANEAKVMRRKKDEELISLITELMALNPVSAIAIYQSHYQTMFHGPYKFGSARRPYTAAQWSTPEKRAEVALQLLGVLEWTQKRAADMAGLRDIDPKLRRAFESACRRLYEKYPNSTRDEIAKRIEDAGLALIRCNEDVMAIERRIIGGEKVDALLYPKQDVPLHHMEGELLDQMPQGIRSRGYTSSALRVQVKISESASTDPKEAPGEFWVECKDAEHGVVARPNLKGWSGENKACGAHLLENIYGPRLPKILEAPAFGGADMADYAKVAHIVLEGSLLYESACQNILEQESDHAITAVSAQENYRGKLRLLDNGSVLLIPPACVGMPPKLSKVLKRSRIVKPSNDNTMVREMGALNRRMASVHAHKHALTNFVIDKLIQKQKA